MRPLQFPEITTQQIAVAAEWLAGSGNVAEIPTAEVFVQWPRMNEGGSVTLWASGTYGFNNPTTITEEVWWFLSMDGVHVQTIKWPGLASVPAGNGAFFFRLEMFSSGLARQEVYTWGRSDTLSNDGGPLQQFEQIDRLLLDFSVDRRLLLSFQKQASTTSLFNVRRVAAQIASRFAG